MSTLAVALRRLRFNFVELSKAHVRSLWSLHSMDFDGVRPGLKSARVVLVTTVKNELPRLPWLLRYYRSIGVDHFLVIDNTSDDGSREFLAPMTDVSVVTARGSFKAARYGYDWANSAVNRYCHRKWVLYVDADESFVWPLDPDGPGTSERGSIHEFCERLEHRGALSSQSILLDMYSARQSHLNEVEAGQDPLDVCDRFDPDGYQYHFSTDSQTTWIKGGLRGRLFFADDITASPALNKTPLIRWSRGYAFLRATHMLAPAKLNSQMSSRTSALLHFKFTSIAVSKVEDAAYRDQHDREYAAYGSNFGSASCLTERSEIYSTPHDLVRVGLIAKSSDP